MKEIKIKGIKKAVGEFNSWHGAAIVYYDRSDGEVWTNIYVDSNSWSEYHSPSIIRVMGKGGFYGRERLTMDELRYQIKDAVARYEAADEYEW